jgi:hypothetical protein
MKRFVFLFIIGVIILMFCGIAYFLVLMPMVTFFVCLFFDGDMCDVRG